MSASHPPPPDAASLPPRGSGVTDFGRYALVPRDTLAPDVLLDGA